MWANLQRIIELSTQKIVIKLSKIWVWVRDPRSRIQDPEKTYSGSRGQKGTGSRIRIRNTYVKDENPSQPKFIRHDCSHLLILILVPGHCSHISLKGSNCRKSFLRILGRPSDCITGAWTGWRMRSRSWRSATSPAPSSSSPPPASAPLPAFADFPWTEFFIKLWNDIPN